MLSVLLQYTDSDYPFPLISSNSSSKTMSYRMLYFASDKKEQKNVMKQNILVYFLS